MNSIWLVLALVGILVMVFYRPTKEHMTNKDVLESLSRFEKDGKKPSKPAEQPIYGPRTTKVEEPKPTHSGKSGISDNMVYPDIYGPEITPIPGAKKAKKKPGEETSDCADDDTYQFNPDLQKAFPSDGSEPSPFLTDFSKFQH